MNSVPFQTGWMALRAAPRMATSGTLMIGVNPVPQSPPREEIEKQTALHLGCRKLSNPGTSGKFRHFRSEIPHTFGIAVADDRDHQPVGRINGKPNVRVAFQDNVPAAQRRIEVRESLQRRRGRLDQKRKRGDFAAPCGTCALRERRNASKSVTSAASKLVT